MYISPDHELLQYSGRIDFEEPKAPVFVFPCSSVALRFNVQGGADRAGADSGTGAAVLVTVTNKNAYCDNYLGYILDGKQGKFRIDNTEQQTYTVVENLAPGEHSLLLFKRMDSCHTFTLHGIEIQGAMETSPHVRSAADRADHAKNASRLVGAIELLPCPPKPERRIEVYGDSVSAGEVAEAVDYVGKPDPEWHNGEFSNSWYSYSWITARKLNAEIHDIAQGGVALIDGIGWYNDTDYVGMESVYDKLRYSPALGVMKPWDFSLWTPQVVVIAVGQNDSHPYDFMKEEYEGAQAAHWRECYGAFVRRIRELYPDAEVILATTILEHDKSWDLAIDAVCKALNDPKVHHFLYKRNGAGTPGHIRVPEAEEMAEELAGYINSLEIPW
ncbi:MAG: GDSL-type esterase/lipase family protein [Lachnospiraceae bacterium]|nr:GDSL-type esterase/lipase family protein [Lachnospiraceae bacterium]